MSKDVYSPLNMIIWKHERERTMMFTSLLFKQDNHMYKQIYLSINEKWTPTVMEYKQQQELIF